VIKPLRELQVVQMACSRASVGQCHSLALDSSGDVYAFGTSTCGALGLTEITQTRPEPIRMTHTTRMVQVACGARHSVFLSEAGHIYSCGDNRYGQLGLDSSAEMTGNITGIPQKVPGVPPARLVTCGDSHTLAVLREPGIFSWGANSSGQCGQGSFKDIKVPARILFPLLPKQEAPFKMVSFSAGAQHTLVAVRLENKLGYVFGFGSNVDGQLGLGRAQEGGDTHFVRPFSIAEIGGKPTREIIMVACAGNHSITLSRTGEVYAFGSNRFGQLGYVPPGGLAKVQEKVKLQDFDGVSNLFEPTRVAPLRVHHVRYVSTSDRHTMVIAA